MTRGSFVIYKGQKYWLQSSGRYYQSGRKDDEERLLHRRIYRDNHGTIPDGMHIHHRDEDWTNNDIDNLEAITPAEHIRGHMIKRLKDPACRQEAVRNLEAARVEASKWHGSEAGLAWHAEHGRRTWEGREPSLSACEECGKSYDTFFEGRSRFCSSACGQRAHLREARTANEAVCEVCNSTFGRNPHREQRTCGRKCAAVLRARSGQAAANAKKAFVDRPMVSVTCADCGSGFETVRPERAKYCSAKCSNRARYKRQAS